MRSFSEGFSGATGRSTPNDRSRAASREDGAYAAAANENTATATAAKMMKDTTNIGSDLNLNNSSNYKISDCLQRNTRGQQRMTDGVGKQWPDETRVHDQHRYYNGRRQSHQQHHC